MKYSSFKSTLSDFARSIEKSEYKDEGVSFEELVSYQANHIRAIKNAGTPFKERLSNRKLIF